MTHGGEGCLRATSEFLGLREELVVVVTALRSQSHGAGEEEWKLWHLFSFCWTCLKEVEENSEFRIGGGLACPLCRTPARDAYRSVVLDELSEIIRSWEVKACASH
ncbi:hypothetical protein FJT64_006951 [Amphibalanus amphitrite]|uniref:Uncharacterized protein n=1 Tax=Amphibalanus amphitrite TaxID=1232801 RepID=A0A6A4VRJ9_AMPAM|nr:hypothetical protein FJT64_006951 [Amphibalanus amphitrite]